MLAEFPDIDREAIVYCGGSHGGFLGAHLIAKYPDVYKAAVLRNPVTNLVEEVSTADIPDWVYAEAGLPYRSTLRKEDLDKLYALSPISNDLSKIKTPTLLLLGAKDRRVPPSQGLQFYRGLQAAGVKSKVYWFPTQSHPIDDPGCNADCWINSALWYHDALKNTY
ncbi:hypothetical protein SARC_03785 [Sphaeroforma arctica JP610]|uniref:Peptidase S9 prolyl oligopeptidase catalytic domain-containing protein n=1 Tax=Sphaeroforma arctica JP610 TaxID=667725 RepID=A0A0L0G4W1_9EUKA|nr:hypothetical protein SARC_03785 [Sphaeroforma arctica JP610]KNC83964.1 hypothetical protein SARC_03785 [Sphaeroforma arctica JP610]|eukprot:XP_014157866.1 hypothetical protein SARC_03785 [Sphaeroforma arctica JP610]